VNSSAYGSEIVRSAISSIDRGQLEAAVALNLSERRTMTAIILPQAVLRMLPPFGNLLVEHLKTTSLVSLITVTDLAFAGQSLLQQNGEATQVYALVLLLYFCVCFPLSRLTKRLERRFGRDERGAGAR
jgi:polar amino acid transport system permease protein